MIDSQHQHELWSLHVARRASASLMFTDAERMGRFGDLHFDAPDGAQTLTQVNPLVLGVAALETPGIFRFFPGEGRFTLLPTRLGERRMWKHSASGWGLTHAGKWVAFTVELSEEGALREWTVVSFHAKLRVLLDPHDRRQPILDALTEHASTEEIRACFAAEDAAFAAELESCVPIDPNAG